MLKPLILLALIFFIARAPQIRTARKWLDKLYLTILTVQILSAYYGIVILIYASVPSWSDILLLFTLIALTIFVTTRKFHLVLWGVWILYHVLIPSRRGVAYIFFWFRARNHYKKIYAIPRRRAWLVALRSVISIVPPHLDRGAFIKLIAFFKEQHQPHALIFWLTVALHIISLFAIYSFVYNNPIIQGNDMIEGRFGYRSYILNTFPYLKYTLFYLTLLHLIETSILCFFGIIKDKLRFLYVYGAVILILSSYTTAANFTYVTQRDEWRHISAIYNLIKNNAYRMRYAGEDIVDKTASIGGLSIPQKYITGNQTSYVSHYGLYYYLTQVFKIKSLEGVVELYRLFHPFWFIVSVMTLLFFVLKNTELVSSKETFIAVFISLSTIFSLTAANLNFPQYLSLINFLIALEYFLYVVKNKRQGAVLPLIALLLLLSYASYSLLFIALAPLIFYSARTNFYIQKKTLVPIIFLSFGALILLAIFNYYAGNFTPDLLYPLSDIWKPFFIAVIGIWKTLITTPSFFNLVFVERIFSNWLTPFTSRIIFFSLNTGLVFIVFVYALYIIKKRQLNLFHILPAVLVLAYAFIFKISAGENLLIKRLIALISIFAALVLGFAFYTCFEKSRRLYQKLVIGCVFVGFTSFSALSFVNIVHSTSVDQFKLISGFYKEYRKQDNNFCFVADEPEIVLLEAVSSQQIIGGNFQTSGYHFFKEDLSRIRDRIYLYHDKKPLLDYQKKNNIKRCYIMTSYEQYKYYVLLFGPPILSNRTFAIWESVIDFVI